MGGFSPQPEGTGPIFPISSLLAASVTGYSALLAPRTEKNWLPSPPSEVVLAGPNSISILAAAWDSHGGLVVSGGYFTSAKEIALRIQDPLSGGEGFLPRTYRRRGSRRADDQAGGDRKLAFHPGAAGRLRSSR